MISVRLFYIMDVTKVYSLTLCIGISSQLRKYRTYIERLRFTYANLYKYMFFMYFLGRVSICDRDGLVEVDRVSDRDEK